MIRQKVFLKTIYEKTTKKHRVTLLSKSDFGQFVRLFAPKMGENEANDVFSYLLSKSMKEGETSKMSKEDDDRKCPSCNNAM